MKGAVVTTTTWLDLRDAALSATRRGWPMTPDTYPAQAWDTWTQAPYGVLLVCGHAVTVLDLPITLIGLMPTEPLFPVVATSQSRLLAITKADPETPLSPRLAQAARVQQILLTALRDTTAAQ